MRAPGAERLTDTGENGPKCPVNFRLGAESYSSLERGGNSSGHFGTNSPVHKLVSVNHHENTYLSFFPVTAVSRKSLFEMQNLTHTYLEVIVY